MHKTIRTQSRRNCRQRLGRRFQSIACRKKCSISCPITGGDWTLQFDAMVNKTPVYEYCTLIWNICKYNRHIRSGIWNLENKPRELTNVLSAQLRRGPSSHCLVPLFHLRALPKLKVLHQHRDQSNGVAMGPLFHLDCTEPHLYVDSPISLLYVDLVMSFECSWLASPFSIHWLHACRSTHCLIRCGNCRS